jgi:hypothetical protein
LFSCPYFGEPIENAFVFSTSMPFPQRGMPQTHASVPGLLLLLSRGRKFVLDESYYERGDDDSSLDDVAPALGKREGRNNG